MNGGGLPVVYNSPERMELIERIEKTFAKVVYPGDANIVNNPKDLESANMQKRLKGRHWSTVPLAALLEGSSSLPLLTPIAFRFYLPAFMHVSVSRPDDVDVIPENVVSFLTPPRNGGEAAASFKSRIGSFSEPELRTISAFMSYWFNIFDSEELIESDKRARNFWREPTPI